MGVLPNPDLNCTKTRLLDSRTASSARFVAELLFPSSILLFARCGSCLVLRFLTFIAAKVLPRIGIGEDELLMKFQFAALF